jgi:hypothetical protein
MGIFKSKLDRQVELGVSELQELVTKHYKDWDKVLKLTITAKTAAGFPLEIIEPVIREMWVECYVRAMSLHTECEIKYNGIAIRIPEIQYLFPIGKLGQIVRAQGRTMGEDLGSVVREICEIKPEYLETLGLHLEEPELSKIKNEAKEIFKNR